MLPSSHLVPMNPLPAPAPNGSLDRAQVRDFPATGGSDREQGERLDHAERQAKNAVRLAGEFSEFIAAAAKLENSYRSLQEEVAALGRELSKRNAALKSSLAENEQMRLALEQLVDSMPCGVLVLDQNRQVTMINPESRRLLGLVGGGSGKQSTTTLRQLSAQSGINLEAFCGDSSDSDVGQEFCRRDAQGSRWIEVRNRRLFRSSGRRRRNDQTILILRDVTAQKRAEQERESGRKAMALAELTSVLAHEIRNPLASLELFAELIENDGARRQEWISNLRAGIRSLSGTVNNVLSFHGSGSLALAPAELSVLIERSLRFARPLADQAAVALDWRPYSGELTAMCNEGAIQQIVLNLVSNAIRHTPAGGKIEVSLRQETVANGANQFVAEFSDTGCGIRPDQIEHIFEPGFSGKSDSSGLGLAVCERIMRQHGGRIAVSNRVPSGARFELFFPVLPMESATA